MDMKTHTHRFVDGCVNQLTEKSREGYEDGFDKYAERVDVEERKVPTKQNKKDEETIFYGTPRSSASDGPGRSILYLTPSSRPLARERPAASSFGLRTFHSTTYPRCSRSNTPGGSLARKLDTSKLPAELVKILLMMTKRSYDSSQLSLRTYGSREGCHDNGRTHPSRYYTKRSTRLSTANPEVPPLWHTMARYFSTWSPPDEAVTANERVLCRRSRAVSNQCVQPST